MKYLVTGANRKNGIGAEMVRQLVAQGHEVHATARDVRAAEHLNVPVHALDTTNEASIAALAEQFQSLDVLVNNAGTMGSDASLQALVETFTVNAAGPLLLTRALLPALARGERKLAAHISSRMGSIADNTSGGYYAYRMSKAALNMASRSLSVELRGRGISSVVLHPGWVQTDMGGSGAPLSVQASVKGLLSVIAGLSPSDSGQFYDYEGHALPF